MKILVLGLGNDLIADDGIGILAARALEGELSGQADVVACFESGIRLMEYLIDYDRAVLIDAIYTGKTPPGTLTELHPADLSAVVAPSPHYAGLPEIFALAKQLELQIPPEMTILAVEVEDPFTVGGEMTAAVRNALPAVVTRVKQLVANWLGESIHA